MSPSDTTPIALAVLGSYLLGAVPFGLVLVRLFTGQDLRALGSGNIGATNAMRAAGKPVGITAFLLDAAKGWAPVALIAPLAWFAVDAGVESGLEPVSGSGFSLTAAWVAVLCGAAAVLGHCFPVYLGFKGGKGVATGCGALIGLDWRLFPIGGAVWLVTLLLSRYVGLSSIAMGLTFPLAAWILGAAPSTVLGAGLLTLLILIRHRSNMGRMLAGTEPKVFQSRTRGESA